MSSHLVVRLFKLLTSSMGDLKAPPCSNTGKSNVTLPVLALHNIYDAQCAHHYSTTPWFVIVLCSVDTTVKHACMHARTHTDRR